jgi:kynureninase
MTTTEPPATDLAEAETLDAADELAGFRGRFVHLDPDLVYFDGNSLGRLPIATAEGLATVVAEGWGGELIRGWDHWLDLPLRVGDAIAGAVVGARDDEVAVTDSTTVNLFRLASAALDARPGRRTIAIARGEFPTDRYVVEGLARTRDLRIHWIEPDPVEGVTSVDVDVALDEDVALVILSHVNYRSASIAPMAEITEHARAAGALVLWDLSHAAGSIPIDLTRNGVDLAVGCTYKYLNGGPGAPAFLYVRRELQAELRPPIQGWFAQGDQFAMGPRFEPRGGIGGWLVGTPGILGLVGVETGVAMVAEAGIGRIRAKGIALTEYAIRLFDARLAPLGFELGSPRDPARRGAHVSIRRPDARGLLDRLIAAKVLPDFREPDSIRLGLSPLTTSFVEVRTGIERIVEVGYAG